MGMFYRLLIGIGVVCCIVAYDWYRNFYWLTPADRKLVTEEDTAVTVNLELKNTSGHDFSIEITELPEHGSLTNLAGRYLYLPQSDFYGRDQFVYRIKKGSRTSSTAKVEIEITPINDQPHANDLTLKLAEDSSLETLLTGDDPDNDILEFKLIQHPYHGKITGTAPHFVYTPHIDFFGNDSFTYIATDTKKESRPATVSIEVLPVNDAPVANSQTITAFENTPINITFGGIDLDSQITGNRLVDLPKRGVVSIKNGSYRYTPHPGYLGRDSFAFVVRDESQESAPATIAIEVKKITRAMALNGVLGYVIKDGGVAIGNHSRPEHLYHAGKYVPASVLKIVTATAALHSLGEGYRFKTEFFVDDNKNLYIKGFGDPGLTSKVWHEIAKELQSKKIFKNDLNALVVDASAFAINLWVDGRKESFNYFDSPPSTLASNGNTVTVRIQDNRRIQVIDCCTPLTSLVVKKAKLLPKGYQHFNVAIDSDESIRYSSELAVEIFKEYGAVFNEKPAVGKTPTLLEPIFVYKSKSDLKTTVKEMLKDSNNFTANQLLLTLAHEKIGEGVNINDGAQIVSEFLKDTIGIQASDVNLVEGSGLSTKNNIDLLAMLKIMNYFEEYRELLPHLRYSRDSELSKVGRKWNIVAKSGTLRNISTLAGFIQINDKEWKPFVIMLNNTRKERGTVINIIGQYYNS